MYDSSGGDAPLTATETAVLDKSIKDFKPDIFLDIHSGMKGMLYPWASKAEDAIKNDPDVQASLKKLGEVINKIKESDCPDCLAGPAYDILHYESYGCSTDHNFVENNVPISTVWEIYGDNTGLGNRKLRKHLFRMLKMTHKVKNKFKKLTFKARMQFAYKMASELKFNQSDEFDCFDFFNPVSKEDYDKTVLKWSKAIIHLMKLTATDDVKKLRKGMNKNLLKLSRKIRKNKKRRHNKAKANLLKTNNF